MVFPAKGGSGGDNEQEARLVEVPSSCGSTSVLA